MNNNKQDYYDLMGFETQINKIIDRFPLNSPLSDIEKDQIRQEYRNEIIARLEKLYSEEEIGQLITFFSQGVGKVYREKQKEIFSDYQEFMIHLLENHLSNRNTQSSSGSYFQTKP